MIDSLRGLPGISHTQLSAEINGLYCCHGECHPEPVEGHKLSGIDDLMALAESIMEDIWKAKGMPGKISRDMVMAFAKKLWSGLTEGYGKNLIGIDYNTPDARMLAKLQTSVFNFSAAKNYQQMKAITEALVGDDNKLRTYSQFKKEAFAINDEHVNQWLNAEYNTAIAGGQMASKWTQIQSDKEDLPLLQFDAVMDDRTSDICAELEGTILPVDDSFWDQFYPPNHYNCRSTVRQLSEGKESVKADIVYPEKVPAMFKVNLAKRGLAFPPGHPYFKGLPKDILTQAKALIPKDE